MELKQLMMFTTATQHKQYKQKVKDIFGSSIVAYWPLWEDSGSIAYDVSGNLRNGSYVGVDLSNAVGPKSNQRCPYFDGTSDMVNIYSTGLRNAFSGAEGSMLIWIKMSAAGVWTDAAYRSIFMVGANASTDYILIRKTTNNNQIVFNRRANNLPITIIATSNSLDWIQLAMTWSISADTARGFFNGSQVGVDQHTLSTFTGLPVSTACVLGAVSTAPSQVTSGWLAHAILLNRAATPSEISKAYNWN